MISRRLVLGSLAAALVAPRAARAWSPILPEAAPYHGEDWYVGTIPDRPHDIPVVDLRLIDPAYHRQVVPFAGSERPGTILVDTSRRFLYLVRNGGRALRYGIGVGRAGFAWTGTAAVGRKARWPDWRPPAAMRRRRPDLPIHMAGGPDNPLGARALYLYQGGRDTLFRIHGTNEPDTIGQAVSSGCIRMLNQDVFDLYDRVPLGTVVKVTGRPQPRRRWDDGPEFDPEEMEGGWEPWGW